MSKARTNRLGKKPHLVKTGPFQLIYQAADPQYRELLLKALFHYKNSYEQMKSAKGPVNSAMQLHQFIDRQMASLLSLQPTQQITCKKGCSHCCRIHVDITDDEGQLLAVVAQKQEIHIDRDKLKRQSEYNHDNWLEQPYSDWSCVFLDSATGTCKVYEHRPMNCRKHLVTSHPDLCDPRKKKQLVTMSVQHDIEAILSGVLNTVPSGSMAKVLSGILEEQRK